MEELKIITALERLSEITKANYTWYPLFSRSNRNSIDDVDGYIELDTGGIKEGFNVCIRKEIRNYQVNHLTDLSKRIPRFLVFAETIFKNTKELLRRNNVGYLDTYGNCYYNIDRNFLFIDVGKEDKYPKEKIDRAFTKTGLKVIFLFMVDEKWVSYSYREISEKAGVALGAIPPIIEGLKKQGFLIHLDPKRKKIVNKKELMNKWVEAYGLKLKPSIKLGNFMFNIKTMKEWREYDFKDEDTVWGGEPAGDLLTNYLNPESLTIYTNKNTKELIRLHHLLPHENGQVFVFRKFWNFEDKKKTAPPLLVYADLINSGDSRSIETANIIYERYLLENI